MTSLKQVPKTTFSKRKLIFQFVVLASIISFTILTILAHQRPYFRTDLFITLLVQSIHNPIFDGLMRFISWLGYFFPGIMLIIISSIFLYLYAKKLDMLMLIISSLGATLLSLFFKFLVSRPRPDPHLIEQFSIYRDPDSFPSGHVLFFMGFFGFLLFLSFTKLKNGYLRNLLVSIFFLLILLVGLSRIYLGAHWFSDTLGSYLIGFVWLFIVITIYQKLSK